MGEMESFALNLLHSASCAHVYHWQTTSYSAHKALGKFYEAMPDLVDGLVETYMGRNGIFGEVDKEQEEDAASQDSDDEVDFEDGAVDDDMLASALADLRHAVAGL